MKVRSPVLLLSSTWMLMGAAEIPLDETGFVDHAPSAGKAALIEQLGDPSSTADIIDPQSGQVIATIWHYHYINTNADGEYYKTTELDFKGDYLVNIIFSMVEDGTTNTSQAGGPSGCRPSC